MKIKHLLAAIPALFLACALTAAAQDFSPVEKMPSQPKKDPNAKPSTSSILRTLDRDSATLCRDQATLIHRVETIKTTLALTANGLALISVLEADIKALDLSVEALYRTAQAAEAIPQARPKVKPIKESLTAARASIKSARTTMAAITAKTEPVRLKLKTAADAAEKVEMGFTAANIIPCSTLPTITGAIKGCLATLKDPKKACVSGQVDRNAGSVDDLVKDYDSAVRVLIYHPEVSLPNVDFANPFNEDLKALETLRAQLNALTSRLDGLSGKLSALNAVLDQNFSFSFPYPDPTLTDPLRFSNYTVNIGFRTIIEGSNAIQREIENRLSGFLWGILKGLGVNSYIESLQNAANGAVNALLDAVNFDVDVNLPSLDALNALNLDEVVLESGLDAFKISTGIVNLGDLDRLPGRLNHMGLSLDDPDFCANYASGCSN